MSNDKMDKSRDRALSSPDYRRAKKAEDAAMERWKKLSDDKSASKAAVKEAYKEYTSLARSRARLAQSKAPAFNKGGMTKKQGYAKGGMVNCGASMKPGQKRTK